MKLVHGIGASPGIALGPAFHFRRTEITIERQEAPDPLSEWVRIEDALSGRATQVEALAVRVQGELGSEQAAIFAAQLEMLDDPDLLDAARR